MRRASRPGHRVARRTSTRPRSTAPGMGVTATLDGDEYVINGRKYWPCNVGGWDNKGANLNLVVVRTDPEAGGTSGLSAIIVERGTPGITYNSISTSAQRIAPNCEIIFDNARVPAANLIEGTKRQRRPPDQPQLRLVRPGCRDRGGRRGAGGLRGRAGLGQDLHRGRAEADHQLPVPGLRAGRCRREDRGGAVLLLEVRALPRPARLPRRDARRDVQDPLHGDAVRLCLQVHAGRRGQLGGQEAHVRPLPAGGVDPAALRRGQLRDAAPPGARRHGRPVVRPARDHGRRAVEFTKAMEGIDTVPGPRR